MDNSLEKKVTYFFSSPYRGRDDVRRSIRGLQRFGRLALVGGMLRDLSLFGNADFRSDLDFVITPYDLEEFESHMRRIGAKMNRFGGYALPSRKWRIDVWALQKSWAHVNGHVKLSTINDLRKATFFNCDAIIYDLASKNIRTYPGYFDDMAQKLLELNLEPNPNPEGSAVRAIRYSLLKGFHWGPKLTKYVAETVNRSGWASLSAREAKSFNTQYLEAIDRHAFDRAIERYLGGDMSAKFDPIAYRKGVQLELPL